MRVLVTSNFAAGAPFGQSVRPMFLGREMARRGVAVGNVGIDCRGLDFGPAWTMRAITFRDRLVATRQAIAEFRPDVIYAHQTSPAVAAIMLAGGTPVVADVHSLGSAESLGRARALRGAERFTQLLVAAKGRLGEEIVFRMADRLIACGEELGARVSATGCPRSEVAIVSNGVDPALVATPRVPTSPYPSEPGFHAMATLPAAASSSNARALEFLTQVAAELRLSRYPIALHVIGCAEGPGSRFLNYEGFQPDLRPWLDHADAALLPYPDGAGLCGGARNKLVEYLARARTIVTTRAGLHGLSDAVSFPGVYVADDDPASFASQIRTAVAPSAAVLASGVATADLGWDALAGRALEVLRGCSEDPRRTWRRGARRALLPATPGSRYR